MLLGLFSSTTRMCVLRQAILAGCRVSAESVRLISPFETTRQDINFVHGYQGFMCDHMLASRLQESNIAAGTQRLAVIIDAEIRRQSSLSKSGADEWENVSACGTDDDAPLPPWERVMYKTQPYPPNYVSDDFLSGLKDNGNNSYTLGDVCPKTMILTQHCSTMILMARIFILIKDDIIPLEYVEIAAMLAILFFCLVMYLTRATQSDRFQHVRFAFVVHVTLQILQPVLQTLTSSFTYDTIYALAILISLINILTQDYELTGSDDAYVKNVDPLPMNCLILVAILISSRFGSSQKATAYMQLYVMTFTMLPLLQRFMMVRKYIKLVYAVTLFVVMVTGWCLYRTHHALVPIYIIGNILVNLVAPLGYIYAQRFKRNVSGPWNPDQVPLNRDCS